MTPKRLMFAVAALAGVAALIVPAAAADPPFRISLGTPPDITGRYCPGFDVTLHASANNEVATIFSNGAAIITGTFKVDVSGNGKTVSVNASGPVSFSSDGTTQVLRGNSLVFGAAGDLGPGSPPTLELDSGIVVITYGPDGSVTSVTRTGNTRDLCAILADP
jgi:hypothetical protein